jgi:hypothetical protein
VHRLRKVLLDADHPRHPPKGQTRNEHLSECGRSGVARWLIFRPKIPILVNF